MIINFKNFLLEKEKITRNYYIFDWDDNLLEMPTKIYLYDKKQDEIISVSTKEFVNYRNDENYDYVDYSFIEFRDDGSRGNQAFIEDMIEALNNKRFANSWDDFIKCLRNGSLFAIVTARGHDPIIFKKGIKYIIENILNKEDYEKMIKNLISFRSFYDTENNEKNENELITEYLDKCGYYPINNKKIYEKFNLNPVKNQEKLKLACINDFMDKVKKLNIIEKTTHFNYDYDIKIKFGFSDDDYKNASIVSKYGKDISVYYTKNYKEKIN
jgi:hypothetical protein